MKTTTQEEKARSTGQTTKNKHDAAKVRIPPPLLFLFFVFVGVVIQFLWSGGWGSTWGVPLRYRLALALAPAGAALVIIALSFQLFRRAGQNPDPRTSTPAIITTGIYQYTRNPMYVGLALLQLAIGIALGNFWIILLLPGSGFAVYHLAIKKEEAYLAEKFGTSYRAYCRQVRRWL